MRAAILSIGDELTLGQTVDSNSAWLANELAGLAALTVEHRTVADDRLAIADAIRQLARAFDVLIATGGLGPTADDLTRHGLADVLDPGASMVVDEAAASHVRGRFARSERPMPASNLIQAERPASTHFLPNPHGTAMGLAGRLGTCRIFALPGPPNEMKPMFRDYVAPAFEAPVGVVLRTASVHSLGLGESAAAELLGDLMDRKREPLVGITVSRSTVSARIRARGSAAGVDADVLATIEEIERRWNPYAFGRNDDTLPGAVGKLLCERGASLVTAESCTGGLLGSMVVTPPGASEYYRGGWVTYSNDMKQSQLGVAAELIERHGAVSEEVASAMAQGALRRAGAMGNNHFSLAITGIAGPEGGSREKPVGTVCVAVARVGSRESTAVRRFEFPGDRELIRDRAARFGLQMLRLELLDSLDRTSLLWERPSPRAVADHPRVT